MIPRARRLWAVVPPFVVAASFTSPPRAAAAEGPSKEECISANESAQTHRQAGKLQAARAELLVCVARSCPSAVRDDCAERLNDVERAIPTIVFTAQTGTGEDLSAVTVAMDGAKIAERLEGTALAVEPGEHLFEFTAEGLPPVSRKLVVREGVKGRIETILFGEIVPKEPPAVAAGPERAESDTSGESRRILAYALGGAGVLGVGLGTYFGLRANATYDDAVGNCPAGPSSCTTAGVEGGETAHTQATVSTVSFVLGGALLAGGVVVFLTAPKRSALRVQPTAGARSAGLVLGGSF